MSAAARTLQYRHFGQAHYVLVFGGGVEAGFKGDQAMVGAGWTGLVGNANGGSRGVTDRMK